MVKHAVALDDKYTQDQGQVFASSVQALVRLPLVQKRLDELAGWNTAGFISGYRGSPIGVYDAALWRAKAHLARHNIEFLPAVNEELALTAVRGTQQLNWYDKPKYDDVFAIWYGKMLGVDRAHEALKMGNFEGSSKKGGVLVVAGDDHGGKSSATAQGSEQSLAAAYIPILFPSNTQEILDYGLMGIAMSRFSGLYVALKCTNDTMEASASIDVDLDPMQFVTPEDFDIPESGLNILQAEFMPLPQEAKLMRHRIPAAQAFARANRVDRTVIDGYKRTLGIVTSGKSYMDLRQALTDMGIDQAAAEEIGLRVYKVGMIWPLEPDNISEFVSGHDEILVVEEKLALVENQLRSLLYNKQDAKDRPPIVGKKDENDQHLVSDIGEVTPADLIGIIAGRLAKLGCVSPDLEARIAAAQSRVSQALANQPAPIFRPAYFCSGCPHNRSTNVPEGELSYTGVGCHAMAYFMQGRTNAWAAAMGAEGALWAGMHYFTETDHAYQNLGDGTYFHSGSLGFRQAVASGANVTFKLLYNDAIAMTGGQPIDGTLTVDMMARQLAAEGARQIVVVTDEPDKYPVNTDWPRGLTIRHRDDLNLVQKELSQVKGATALIYDQTCAAEKRRRRKRGLFPDPDRRLFINESVCEGCGDCSVKSNCLSVMPKDTEFGRKRVIDQSSCNKDYSCVNGFCPSFVSIKGGGIRKIVRDQKTAIAEELFASLPQPEVVKPEDNYAILITGIGGTGVLTVGSVLGMAAHLEGKSCSVQDMTGMAQKGGAVLSHLRIAHSAEAIEAARIGIANADLMLGCDLVVSGGMEPIRTLIEGKSSAVINSHVVPTAAFQANNKIDFQSEAIERLIKQAVGADNSTFVDATEVATTLLGNSIATNLIMTGVAWQLGLIPLAKESIERAIELNGVSIEMSLAAFSWGRVIAHDRQKVAEIIAESRAQALKTDLEEAPIATDLDDVIAVRVKQLTDYQNEAYAARYTELVSKVRQAEKAKFDNDSSLTPLVAKLFARLMAYKDEYEVARLYTNGDFMRRVRTQFEGDFKLNFHMAPPLISKRDPDTGHLRKRTFGPWMFHALIVLAKLKFLRGTALDFCGRTDERKMERRLIGDYESLVNQVLELVDENNLSTAVELLAIYDDIKGFGHVKEGNLKTVLARQENLLHKLKNPDSPVQIEVVKVA